MPILSFFIAGDFASINNNDDIDKMPQQPASVLLVCKINDSR